MRPCHQSFHPALELRARKHYFAIARETPDANVGADAHDAPGIATAGVLLSHLHGIAHRKRHRSGQDEPLLSAPRLRAIPEVVQLPGAHLTQRTSARKLLDGGIAPPKLGVSPAQGGFGVEAEP